MSDSEKSRERRQRLLRRAFDNLGALPKQSMEGAVPAAPPPPASEGPPPGPASVSTPELARMVEVIEAKASTVGGEDFFARLNLPRSAGRDQVKAAYLALVKTFHPDRLPPALAHLGPKAAAVFAAIREAYETLQDDAGRAACLAQLSAPSEANLPSGKEEAESLARQAEQALKRREYARAAELFRAAQAVTEKPAWLAMQAWATYLDPERKGSLQHIEAQLADALKRDPRCDRAAYALGVVARVKGEVDRAERYFQQAVEANPRNAEAATELRLLKSRRGKPSGKLFG